jgi:hypothetical protein
METILDHHIEITPDVCGVPLPDLDADDEPDAEEANG